MRGNAQRAEGGAHRVGYQPTMSAPYVAEIERMVQQVRPRSLLAVGADAGTILEPFTRQLDCRYLALPAPEVAALTDQDRFDVALVSTGAEAASKAPLLHLLAALRDRYAHYLFVALELSPRMGLTQTNFLALGMRHVGDYPSVTATHALYAYNIADYKNTPDWLNSQHWAHPELFDKFRW